MNKKYVFIAIAAFFLLVLMATNPSIEDHRQAVISFITTNVNKEVTKTDNEWEAMGQILGISMVKNLIESFLTRDNYILFSLTKLSLNGKSKIIGVGIFGKVWLMESAKKSIDAAQIKQGQSD